MPPGIYRLPLELVREVAAESSSRDLAALALTARHFHAWVNPCLYEHNIKHQNANAAVWAVSHGRLGTLKLIHQAETQSSNPFINKIWNGDALCGLLLPNPQLPQHRVPEISFTLLHLAAQSGHDDVIVWLLQHGADVDAQSDYLCGCDTSRASTLWTPLHVAICHSQEKTVELLLANNASLQTNEVGKIEALHTAAAMGLTSTIRHLSALPGFNPNVKYLVRKTPLHYAIQGVSSLSTTQTLLDVGANVQGAGDDESPYYSTPLRTAIRGRDFEVAATLLRAGANFNAESERVKKRRDEKKTRQEMRRIRRLGRNVGPSPLHIILQRRDTLIAGISGQYEVVQRKIIRELLDSGVDINQQISFYDPRDAKDDGFTPLIMAVRHSDAITVRLLLERGAEVGLQDGEGRSALCHALSDRVSSLLAERMEKVKALLEHGASLLDEKVIWELTIRRNSRAMVQTIANSMGPENLTDLGGIPKALAFCCLFQERQIYDSIKRYAQVQARATSKAIRDVLERAAGSKRACVSSLLHEMRPEMTLDVVLDQWRHKMSAPLIKWLEEIRGRESGD